MQVTHKRINYRPNGGPFVSHSAYKFDSPPDDHGSGLGTKRDETKTDPERGIENYKENIGINSICKSLLQHFNNNNNRDDDGSSKSTFISNYNSPEEWLRYKVSKVILYWLVLSRSQKEMTIEQHIEEGKLT